MFDFSSVEKEPEAEGEEEEEGEENVDKKERRVKNVLVF